MLNKLLIAFVLALAPLQAFAQSAATLPISANTVADIGNGPIKVRMIAGNASIFTSQGSGVGSTSGSSTVLTLTGTPTTPPIVGGLISGVGITSGTTISAYNGTTGITLSAAMNVAGGTTVAWGAACPSALPSNVIQASPQADYYIMYTQARVCAVSPGGPVNTLLIDPIFYDQTTPNGGSLVRSAVATDTILPSDCGGTVQEGTGSTGLFTVTLPAVSGFPAVCSVKITNGDTARAKTLSGFPTPSLNRLYPLQAIEVSVINGTWAVTSFPGRWRLPASTSIYVDSALGNDANDCLAAGVGACLTSSSATARIFSQFDLNNKTVTLQFASGQSFSNVNIASNAIVSIPVGTAADLIIDGGGSTFTSSTTAAALFIATARSTNIVIQNVTIGNTGGGDAIQCASGGFSIFSGVTFSSAAGGTQIHIAGDCIGSAPFNYAISGGSANHVFAESGAGEMNFSNTTITLSGTPAFSGAFAYAWVNGSVFANGTTFSGSATGMRYLVTTNGSINTNGGGANFFPGSTPGMMLTGGAYDSPGTPSVSACGTTPGAPVGKDISGSVMEGTTATGCTIAFTTASAPKSCSVNSSNSTVQAGLVITTLSATQLVVTHPSASGATLYWNCPTQ